MTAGLTTADIEKLGMSFARELIKGASLEDRFQGLTVEDRFQGLTANEYLSALPVEGLSDEEILKTLKARRKKQAD